MKCLNICTSNDKIELIILAVINATKINWHTIYIDKNTNGNYIYKFLIKYYNNNKLDVDVNMNGINYELILIDNINNYILENPHRMCAYIYTS